MFVTTTGRTSSVTFNMAELTASHLTLAMNGSPLDIDTSSPDHVIVEPPDLGREQRVMFGFESEDHSERWIYRQCFQSGTLKIARAKGNTVATIAATFSLEKPASGKRLFAAVLSRARRGGWMVTGGGGGPAARSCPASPRTPAWRQATQSVQVNGANLGGATADHLRRRSPRPAWSRFPRRRYTCDTPAHAAGAGRRRGDHAGRHRHPA